VARSALAVGVTLIVGRVPPPLVLGCPYTQLGLSDASKCSSSVYSLPAESVTLLALAPFPLDTPVTTTSRLPDVMLDVGVTDRLVAPLP
jgi:hypothetical protein